MLKEQSQDSTKGEVLDLFCGIGGLSHGLRLAGFKIVAGFDTDAHCKYAFETNNAAQFHCRDVALLRPNEIKALFTGTVPSVLAGCAPCQPFSNYKRRYGEDPKWNLVNKFALLAAKVTPDFVTMENVPALLHYKSGKVFENFCDTLECAGYSVDWQVVKCEHLGVPQRRRRLVVLASRIAAAPKLTINSCDITTVRDAIGALPPIRAGEAPQDDILHVSAGLSAKNLERIRASKPGGTWRDWPPELMAKCHTKKSGKTYSGVYARMTWNDPAPTLTTQCYGYGNGRFGHPEQNRAISLREAAILQSFPHDYEFLPPGEKPSFSEVGRWIGNAVPVKLGTSIGDALATSIEWD